jgi:hypothetical protein
VDEKVLAALLEDHVLGRDRSTGGYICSCGDPATKQPREHPSGHEHRRHVAAVLAAHLAHYDRYADHDA